MNWRNPQVQKLTDVINKKIKIHLFKNIEKYLSIRRDDYNWFMVKTRLVKIVAKEEGKMW